MISTKTSNGFEVKSSNSHTMFLPAFIDDYGFTPEEFRVFGRVMRRSLGSDESCYESIPNLAKALFISERLIRRAFTVLEACGAIARTVRPGKSDIYDFNPASKWKPSSELHAIRRKIDAEIKRKDRTRKSVQKTVVVAETIGVTPGGNATPPLAETTPPVVAETQDEGIPIEGKRRKEEEKRAVAAGAALQSAAVFQKNSVKSSRNPKPPSPESKPPQLSNNPESGKPPEASAPRESRDVYLARKQSEFPLINVPALFKRYCNYCKEKNRQPVTKVFDIWCAKEEPPMEMPPDIAENVGYINPLTGRGLA